MLCLCSNVNACICLHTYLKDSFDHAHEKQLALYNATSVTCSIRSALCGGLLQSVNKCKMMYVCHLAVDILAVGWDLLVKDMRHTN